MRKYKITVYFVNGDIETYIGNYEDGIRNLHIYDSEDTKKILIPYVNILKCEREVYRETVL